MSKVYILTAFLAHPVMLATMVSMRQKFSMLLSPLTLCGVSLGALFLGESTVLADSYNDHMGPREIALGESRRAGSFGSMSTTLNPAGLALNNQLVFDINYGYRNSDKASLGMVSACDSTTPVGGCFYYRYMTAKPEFGSVKGKRRLHEGGVTMSRALSQQILLGINSHYFDYNSNTEEDVRGYAVDVGLMFVISSSVSLGAVGYNLIGTKADRYQRSAAVGVAIRPGSGNLSISLDALWNLETEEKEKTGRYGAGVEYIMSSADGIAYPLRAGGLQDVASKSSYATGGVGFASQKMGLDIGVKKQVGGVGDELVVLFGLRLIGPAPQSRR